MLINSYYICNSVSVMLIITWYVQGAVGLRMRIYGRSICFVNCHFAAHLEAVNRRNADFDHVYKTMSFSRAPNLVNTSSGMLPYLLLSCFLATSSYSFWILCGSPLVSTLLFAAAVSSAIQTTRLENVGTFCF